MSPITRIALRRIRKNLRQNIFFMISIFFSMLMISFFLFFELQTLTVQNVDYAGLPFTSFPDRVKLCMNITVVCLLLLTFLNVRIYGSMRNEENARALAVLTSVGAENRQKRAFIITEILILYFPPTVLGVGIGIIPGIMTGDYFQGNSAVSERNGWLYVILAIGIITAGTLLSILCNVLPSIKLKRRSVIVSVKKQNARASEERHSYRQSKTFQNQTLLRRLARKSIDYYQKTYNRIALTFASSALYPFLAVLMLWYIGKGSIILDANPYDGADTTAAVLQAVDRMAVFLCGGFFVLTCMGILQAVLMMRLQTAARKKSTQVYLSVGMPECDIKKMIHLELKSVFLRGGIYWLFGAFILYACYGMMIGG